MRFADRPIRSKLMAVMLITSGAVMLLSCAAFILYESLTFRTAMIGNMRTLGEIIAANSTASLAFDNKEDATETLSAVKAEPHIVAAALYNADGELFARYPADAAAGSLPSVLEDDGYRFEHAFLIGLQPVAQGTKRWGTLYLQSDMRAMYERLTLYSGIALLVMLASSAVAYLLSRALQHHISLPILALVDTARVVSDRGDYSVRAQRMGGDELGLLTDAFNTMLAQIQREEKTRSQLVAIVQSSDDAIISKSLDGIISSWNPGAEKLFGYLANECIGRPMRMLIPHDRLAEEVNFLERISRGEGIQHFETVRVASDGRHVAVSVTISPVRNSHGEIVGASTIARDITERKQSERRLQAQLGRLDLLHRITRATGERQDLLSIFQVVIRSLEDSMPIDFGCICLYDPAEHSLTVSAVGAHSSALAMQLAMTEAAHIPIDANGLSRCVQGHLVHESDIGEAAFPFPSRLASAGLRSLVVAPLRAESRVFGVLVAARKQANTFSSNDCEFLKQLSEHVGLAAHQAQLYSALQRAYDDLRQSQQNLLQQERLRALGQMASGVAHDINNAISPIGLYTESLLERETGLSDRGRGYLTTIQRAIEDVAQTVSRMRDFYRQREPEMALTRIDLNRIVPQVLELTRVRWRDLPQERGVVIDVKTDLQEPLAQVLGAEAEIRDALTNLVFNAIDAMPDGGAITVRTRSYSAAQGPMVALEVADTGVGMTEEVRQRCLEPFFTTKGERGSGLGLAMVYGMAQRHAGELDVESAPGEGTRFSLRFPVAEAETGGLIWQAELQRPARSLSILLIDDDPLIIESVRETLQNDGHRVTAADGGQAGIDAFLAAQRSGQMYSVVITDLGMPYVDGRRVSAAIKAASPTTPVLLLTGWGQRLVDEKEIPDHVDRVLNKPPKLRELRATLAALTRDQLPSL